jgi:hypothetical protein
MQSTKQKGEERVMRGPLTRQGTLPRRPAGGRMGLGRRRVGTEGGRGRATRIGRIYPVVQVAGQVLVQATTAVGRPDAVPEQVRVMERLVEQEVEVGLDLDGVGGVHSKIGAYQIGASSSETLRRRLGFTCCTRSGCIVSRRLCKPPGSNLVIHVDRQTRFGVGLRFLCACFHPHCAMRA